MIRMLVFINSNKVLGTIELSEEKFVLLLTIFVEYDILLVSIFFPSFKYSIIINLLIRHSCLKNYFLKNPF